MRAWLASLTDADLDAPPVRDEDRQPLWHYVMHLVSHGLQQFSEAAVLLTRAGHSPGEIGFLEFVMTRESGLTLGARRHHEPSSSKRLMAAGLAACHPELAAALRRQPPSSRHR